MAQHYPGDKAIVLPATAQLVQDGAFWPPPAPDPAAPLTVMIECACGDRECYWAKVISAPTLVSVPS